MLLMKYGMCTVYVYIYMCVYILQNRRRFVTVYVQYIILIPFT
jgi:hypothetical protein